MVLLVNLLATLGIAAVFPACLRRIDDPRVRALSRVWLLAAVPGAIAVWMPRGPDAVAMTGLYAAAAIALAGCVPFRLARAKAGTPHELTLIAALLIPLGAATAQLADRANGDFGYLTSPQLAVAAALLHLGAAAAATRAATNDRRRRTSTGIRRATPAPEPPRRLTPAGATR
jgi:hypothetical protein